MNKYIIELLETETTVIVPDFGALMGAGKSLMFNPILKFNDGKLVKFIASKEGKDEQEVANMVAKHVKEITAVLDKGEVYDIFGLGSFSKNADGRVTFKVSQDGSTNNNSDEKPAVEKKVVVEPKQEDKKPEVKQQAKPIIEEKKEEPIKQDKELSKQTPPVVQNVKETPPTNKKEPVKNSPKKEVKKENKASKKTAIDGVQPKKKKKGWIIWLVILLIIFGGGGTFVALKWKEVNIWITSLTSGSGNKDKEVTENKKPEKKKKDKETDDEKLLMLDEGNDSSVNVYKTITDTLEEEPIEDKKTKKEKEKELAKQKKEEEKLKKEEEERMKKEEKEKKKQTKVEESVNASSDLKYHISVGAFSDRSNAEKLVSKLQEAGFSNARILPGRGLAQVVAGSYSSREDANTNLSKAKEFSGSAYVIKR